MPTDSETRAKLSKMVNGARTAFMVTRSGDHGMHGRPMQTAEVTEDFQKLYFSNARDSGKTREIKNDDHVFLGYSNSSGAEWVCINGRARVVDDRAKIKELWNPIWKNWFKGPDDPNLVLIEVTPESAEYWDSGSQVIEMFKFAIAAVTGKHMDEGEHERVNLQ